MGSPERLVRGRVERRVEIKLILIKQVVETSRDNIAFQKPLKKLEFFDGKLGEQIKNKIKLFILFLYAIFYKD